MRVRVYASGYHEHVRRIDYAVGLHVEPLPDGRHLSVFD
jgi:hypothetical protein